MTLDDLIQAQGRLARIAIHREKAAVQTLQLGIATMTKEGSRAVQRYLSELDRMAEGAVPNGRNYQDQGITVTTIDRKTRRVVRKRIIGATPAVTRSLSELNRFLNLPVGIFSMGALKDDDDRKQN
jgi:hypothetical protein